MAVEIFKLVGSIFVDNDKANESISKTDEKAEGLSGKFLKGVGTAAKWGAGIAAAAGAGATALYGMATKSAEATDRIDKMSQKIGLSREAFQEMDFACSQSGMSVDTLQSGMKTLTSQIDSGAEGFDKLGVSLKNSDGSLRNQEDVMFDTLSALQGMENQTDKARLASELFGKSGTELMPMLNGATGSIDEMRQKAHDLGLVLDDNAINNGVAFTDMVDQIKRSFGAVATQVGVEVMPILMELGQFILDNMPTIQEVVSTTFSVIQEVVTIAGQLISGLIDVIKALVENAQTEGTFFNEVWTEIQIVFETVFKALQDIFAIFTDVFNGDWEGAWNGIKTLFSDIWDGIVLLFQNNLDAIISIFSGMWDAFKTAGATLLEKVKEGFVNIWGTLTTWVSTSFDGVITTIKGFGTKMFDTGKEIMSQVWEGLKNVWTDITGWIADRAEDMKDALMFWKKSKDEMDEDNDEDGSHAGGLDSVPFDGYRAILHKKEKVLTADEAEEYRKGKGKSDGDFIINIGTVENKGEGTMSSLLQEAEFYRRQRRTATGGA